MSDPRYVMNDLLDDRKRLHVRMTELVDRAKRENRDPDPSERAELERLEERIADLGHEHDKWKREQENDELRRPIEHIVRPTSTRAYDDTGAEMRKLFRGEIRGINLTPPSKREARETRDFLAGATPGSALVPITLRDQLYYFLSSFSAIRRTKVQILSTSSGEPLRYPRATTYGTASLTGEGSAISESDPVTDYVTLGSWGYKKLLQASTEFIEDEAVDINEFVARESAQALVNGESAHLLRGTGSNQPSGLLTNAGTATTTQTLATGVMSYSDLVNARFAIAPQYRSLGMEWVASDTFVAATWKLSDSTGRPLFEPALRAGQPDSLLGDPIYVDSFMTAIGTAAGTPAAVGFWGGGVIRDVGIRLEVSNDYAFANDLRTWRCVHRWDSARVDDNAIKIIKSPTT